MREEETLLRDQFLLGLREGPIRQSLRLQLHRDPELTFEGLRREAVALELDHAETVDPPVCMAVLIRMATSGFCAPTPSEVSDWKQTLRTELMKDVREQMTELSRTLLEELRRERPHPPTLPREHSYSDGSREPGRRPARPTGPRFQWDEQGRPICNSCGESGHISHHCGPRRGSQGGF